MNKLNFKISTIFILALTLLFISCRKKDLIRPGDSLPVAYGKAKNQFDKEKYGEAIRAFEVVIRIGRGTEFGQDAQYYLAESHFRDKSYLLAASEFERYISLFPRSERREDAAFKEAFCYYKLSPRYRLDQRYTRKTIEKFNLFESRYPNSDKLQEAAKYVDEMREKLARKLYNAADLYMRTDQYEAATIYYGLTIDRYPETLWAQRALVNQINAYVIYADNSIRSKQEERYQQAVNSYEKYLQLFPEGEYRSRADRYVDKAREALFEINKREATASTSGSDSSN